VVEIVYDPKFVRNIKKIKDRSIKEKLKKQIAKVIEFPEVGKPMKYIKKGTRELYVSPYRLSYKHIKEENKIILLDLYHKDRQ
jgi:mRNA-degrading endonuclease RelE of RelBE toxin-antitoxin system